MENLNKMTKVDLVEEVVKLRTELDRAESYNCDMEEKLFAANERLQDSVNLLEKGAERDVELMKRVAFLEGKLAGVLQMIGFAEQDQSEPETAPSTPQNPTDQKKLYSVKLISTGLRKIEVIKTIRRFLSIDLRQAKNLADSWPVVLTEGRSLQWAQEFVEALIEAGADAVLSS